MSASPPPAAGHPLRYEIIHRNESQLQSSRQELLSTNATDPTRRNEQIQHLSVQTMFHRTSLQCLIQSAAELARRDGREEDVSALDALERFQCQQMEEQLSLPIVPYNNSEQCHESDTNNADEEIDLFDAPDDDLADKFFEIYPEVARCDDDLVYSSSDESSVEEQPKKKKEKMGSKHETIVVSDGQCSPSDAAAKNHNNNIQSRGQNQSVSGNSSRTLAGRDGNSYNRLTNNQNYHHHHQQQQPNSFNNQYNQPHHRHQHQYAQQHHQQQQKNQWQNRPSTGCFDYNETNEPTKENPFRTAKEVQQEEDDWDDGGGRTKKGRNNNRNGWGSNQPNEETYRGPNNMNSRANDSSRPQQMVKTALNGPQRSQGLQKKFQNPKLGATNNGGNNNNGGQMNKPNNSGGGGDDDELPEELQGLNKELVQRIENDIVDRGERVTFDDIAGLDHAKRTVEEMIIMPMKNPEMFTGLREAPKGLLLFGPPGTGKTLIAKAISHESGATFFSISSSSLTSKWIGEGEQLVRTLFKVARYRSPSVIFIDEIDSLLSSRKENENEAGRRMKTEFLVQMDGAGNKNEGHVLTIGATNVPNEIDEAARRRFVKRLYVALPAMKDREVLLRKLFSKNEHSITDKEFAKLAKNTEGYSGADLKSFCGEAALGPLRQIGTSKAMTLSPGQLPPISYSHCRHALKSTSRSVSDADLQGHMDWNETYGTKESSVYNYDDTESDCESDDEEDS